jgi:hypothetical protein
MLPPSYQRQLEHLAQQQNGASAQQAFSQERASQEPRHWVLQVLPPASITLWGLLFLLLPVALLTGSSLLGPFVEQGLTLATSGEMTLSNMYFIKLATFTVLASMGLSLVILRLQVTYFTQWARGVAKPHHLHVAYAPHPKYSSLALLRWQGFRFLRVILPPIACALLAFFSSFVALSLFNHWSLLPGLGSILMFFMVFVVSILGVASFLLGLNSAWVSFTSLYGLCAAVTEPDLNPLQVYNRVNRLAFCSGWTWWLMPLYGFLYLALIAAIGWFLWSYTLEDLTAGKLNWGLLLASEFTFAVLFLALNYARWLSYHRALIAYYNKLPAFIKDQFKPPVYG